MDFCSNPDDRAEQEQEEVSPSDQTSASTTDQRARPRVGTIEKIADIAYDTLRKHDGPWQSDDDSDQSNSTPEDSQ
jgi:hypothetical protein